MSYEIPKTNLPGHARGTRPAPRSGGCLPPGWQSLLGTHPTDAPPSCSSGLTTGQGALRSGPGGRAGRTRERGACGTGTDVWPELWGPQLRRQGPGGLPRAWPTLLAMPPAHFPAATVTPRWPSVETRPAALTLPTSQPRGHVSSPRDTPQRLPRPRTSRHVSRCARAIKGNFTKPQTFCNARGAVLGRRVTPMLPSRGAQGHPRAQVTPTGLPGHKLVVGLRGPVLLGRVLGVTQARWSSRSPPPAAPQCVLWLLTSTRPAQHGTWGWGLRG